ncbi:MAG TPA: hypothetical protein VNJ52_05095 [Patescibacteria group bacterium]|nr:hypothetical protein [Patescibacteria group bacterium]
MIRTLPQIVQEHIEQKARLAYDTAAIMKEARAAEARLQLRMKSDPSLHTFVSHYAEGVLGALPMIPEPMRPMMMRNLLAQIITEWEDCNLLFEAQFKAPQT